MKHKVTCMDCGKTERIKVERGKKIESDWAYYGKLNVNFCQTSIFIEFPKVLESAISTWECPSCQLKEGVEE